MPARPHDAAPLRLFWWKAEPNFGDALSALVTAHMAGRPVRHAGPGRCELFGIGSILQVARRNLRAARADGVRPWIWGSGLLHAVEPDFLDHAQVAVLRGPVTAALLGLAEDRFGDPGLLTDEVVPAAPREDRIGLVVHHRHADDPAVRALAAREPALDLIDVRDPVETVCWRISACRHVFASSLHGLVVADAYGVPNTWLDPQSQSRLKYIDYAAAVGRSMPSPVALLEVPGMLARLRDGPLAHAEGIARCRATLKAHFPAPLRALSHTAA